MKLLVGLGNPGNKYVGTRHNIGFMVAERFAERHRISLKKKGYQGIYGVGRAAAEETTVLLPQTFMNLSGISVNAAFQSLGVTPGDLIVVYDDLDLEFGWLRIRPEGGHGGHNGIRDICNVLGRKDFIRLRVGIGRPGHGNTTGHVLGRFAAEELKDLSMVVETAVDAIDAILGDGLQTAMNRFNKNLLEA
ncbi:MAG: aminoacyl-tRNA hydrolase [Desulfuromonadales bacterium]|nr:aminoacyl-tRNA hydrolase [Desulfuromonadales bacterium]